MKSRGKWFRPAFAVFTACLALSFAPSVAAQQEPVLVGRISYIEGQILRYIPETKDWVIVRKDAPFGLDDALYSDASAKAEFIFPNRLLVRIGASTQIQLIALKSDASEMDVASGVARFYNKNPEGMLKVTTPFGYVLAEPGSTFDLYAGDQSVEVIALAGRVDYFQQDSNAKYEVTPGGASILADATQVATGEGTLDAPWDDWNVARDSFWAKRVEVKGESVKRLPPQLEDDAYDLEESGKWERVNYQGQEREFWRPTVVEESWRPFTVGRWTDYYGDQVWVPEEPFGHVTMHYGNWILVEHRWYWAPPVRGIAVAGGPFIGFGWYPGRVAWISSGPNVGWVPLAPTEIYYSHRLWGPAAVAVAPGVPVTIAIGRLAFVSAAVVVPQASFYSVSNYSSVRVTNINQTTIVNNFHAAPVVNNTVISNYNQSTAKYNFVNQAPASAPHSSVVQRISQNRQTASIAARSVTPAGLKQAATSAKPATPAPIGKTTVPSPTKLTNKLVPPSQVNAPKNQVSFKPVEIKKNTKPAAASPAIKPGGAPAGGPGGRPVAQPPVPEVAKPATHEAPKPPAPEVTKPPVHEAPKPPAPEVTKPPAHEAPKPSAHEAPKPPAHEKPKPPAHEKPKAPAHEAAKPPAHEKPKPQAHEKPKAPAHEAEKPQAHEKPKPEGREKPKPAAHETSKPPAHEKPKPEGHPAAKPPAHEANKPPAHEATKQPAPGAKPASKKEPENRKGASQHKNEN